MGLQSQLFRGDAALQACLIDDKAHVVKGTRGEHVRKIQIALALLDGALIDSEESTAGLYGKTTTRSVLEYKQKRNIINTSYQMKADDIVGKMTIASLDREMTASDRAPRMRGCLNERDPGNFQVVDKDVLGTVKQNDQGKLRFGDAPSTSVILLRVAFQLAFVGRFGINQGNSLLSLITRANALLKPHKMKLAPQAPLESFPFPVPITPNVIGDAEGLRKAANKASAGSPQVLRVIFCAFDGPERLKTTGFSAGPAVGVPGFANFVILNPEIVHPDRGTLLHEMIHASNDKFMFLGTQGHDTDQTSVFSHGDNRPILKQEHADALRGSFFASS